MLERLGTMAPQDQWVLTNGSSLAAALEAHRETICTTLSTRLGASFPSLCYDLSRFDGRAFQKMALRRSPERLHKLVQSTLRTGNLALIEREYRWVWTAVQRFGVNHLPLIVQVHWYFEVARTAPQLTDDDRTVLSMLEQETLSIVAGVTARVPSVQRERA